MAITSVTDAEVILDTIAEPYLSVLAALRTSPLETSKAADALVSLQSALTASWGLLRDLAAIDETTLISVQSAENLIGIWLWRRNFRRSVLVMVYEMTRLYERITEYIRGYQIRVVYSRDGDTLQAIAQRELGDWRSWTLLLTQNPGLSPCDLEPGTPIVIPTTR